ncbi:hypothetical protein ACWIEX_12785 [Bosea sp. NPDC055353]
MTPSLHPLASQPLPSFIPAPGGPDYLMIGMAIFLIAFALALGLLYLRLHALPDHIAHKSTKVQYQVVCVLGLLAMFTHVHAFWVAGLLLALIDIPDFSGPIGRMTDALERMGDNRRNGLKSNDNRQFPPANPRSPTLVEGERRGDKAAS